MKALVITLPRSVWPASMENHWHIVDTAISRHVVGAVMNQYQGSLVTQYEWTDRRSPPVCNECGKRIR